MPNYDNKRDQFQKLGIADPDTPHTQPPPIYPPRPAKLRQIADTDFTDYNIIWNGNFRNFLSNSPYKMCSKKQQEELPSMIDCINADGTKPKKITVPEYRYERLPNELMRTAKKKGMVVPQKSVIKMEPFIKTEKKLELLEKKEKMEGLSPKNDPKSDSENEQDEEEAGREEDENDEEEFDYGNNYFDNGEDFGIGDEDDNLDDGPLY